MHLVNKVSPNSVIKSFITLCIAILCTWHMNTYALPLNITPKAGTQLPTNILPGGSAIAYYTVQNNTQEQWNNNFVKSLPAQVSQVSSGGTYSDTCGGFFNLSSVGQGGDSCTLQLLISGPVPANSTPPLFVCLSDGITCTGTVYPLVVVQTPNLSLVSLNVSPTTATVYPLSTQQFNALATYSDNSTANVTTSATWQSSSLAIASISATGLASAVSIGTISITAMLNGLSTNALLNVVSTPSITATLNPATITANYTFAINFTQSGYGTNVVSATLPGSMSFVGASNCTVTQSAPTCSLTVNAGATTGTQTIIPQLISGSGTVTSSPNPLNIIVTSSLFLYVSDYANILQKCPIATANGSFMSSCSAMNMQATPFANISGTTFKAFNSLKYAYIGDASANLWQCLLNSNGDLSAACTALTNAGTAFVSTRNTTFNTFSGTTYAYVSDDSSSLWQCPMTISGNFSGACSQLSVNSDPTYSEVFNTTFATFAGTTYAYVADHSYALWQCPMNNATGGFSATCTALVNSTPFNATLGVVFNTFSGTTYAYVVDDSTNVWQCPINTSTGAFSGLCTVLSNTNNTFFRTTAISFNTFSGTTYAYLADQSNSIWQCSVDPITGLFGNTCTANNNSNLNDDTLGATFYIP